MNINEKVAEKLASAGPTVVDAVVEHLAKKEIDRRTKAVLDGLDKLQKLEKDIKKMKPDMVGLDEKGVQVSANWSKAKFDEKAKLEKSAGKLREALDAALDKADYGKLFNLGSPAENSKEGVAEEGTPAAE